MEFWGVEVKSGESVKVESGDDFILHLSQACLGESKKDKGNESACLFVKIKDQKLALGTLSHEKIPQISFDLLFHEDFELSHNFKHGSVYFTGYKVLQAESDDETDDTDFGSEEDLPVPADNGSGKAELKEPKPKKDDAAKPDSKQKVKIVEPKKDVKPELENDDSSDEEDDTSDDDEESSDDQENLPAIGEDDESEDEDDESDDEDEKTPEKVELGKKRSAESAAKTPASEKKAKFVTPQKTESKKVSGHTATPHPSKQAAKTPANSNQKKDQNQKSFACNSCNRSFGSENALQSHSKAKHSAA